MKIIIISDLHLEFARWKKGLDNLFPQLDLKADCLCLLGDIGNPFEENYIDYIQNQSKKF